MLRLAACVVVKLVCCGWRTFFGDERSSVQNLLVISALQIDVECVPIVLMLSMLSLKTPP